MVLTSPTTTAYPKVVEGVACSIIKSNLVTVSTILIVSSFDPVQLLVDSVHDGRLMASVGLRAHGGCLFEVWLVHSALLGVKWVPLVNRGLSTVPLISVLVMRPGCFPKSAIQGFAWRCCSTQHSLVLFLVLLLMSLLLLVF